MMRGNVNLQGGYMAQSVQISCIRKQPRNNPFERIEAVGGVNADGTRWRMPVERAISGIEAGKWQFYVASHPKSVWVVIAVSRSGQKYLKTEADGEEPNNLLSLPECP